MKIASRGLREYKETHTYTFSQCSEVFPIVSYIVSSKVVLLFLYCLQISKTQGDINYESFQVVRNNFIIELI